MLLAPGAVSTFDDVRICSGAYWWHCGGPFFLNDRLDCFVWVTCMLPVRKIAFYIKLSATCVSGTVKVCSNDITLGAAALLNICIPCSSSTSALSRMMPKVEESGFAS